MSVPVYDPSMGKVDYDPKGQDVKIAGKVRKGIVEGRPDVAASWAAFDLKSATKPYAFMAAHLPKEEPEEARAA